MDEFNKCFKFSAVLGKTITLNASLYLFLFYFI